MQPEVKAQPIRFFRLIEALCSGLILAILIAGLWPFCAPANAVRWLNGANGIEFGRHGVATSSRAFQAAVPAGPCTIEIWLQPERTSGTGTLMAFDSYPDPRFPFALRQVGSGLALMRATIDGQGVMRRPWLLTGGVFEAAGPHLVAITGVRGTTSVYVDGVLRNSSGSFGLTQDDLSGRLSLGNSVIRSGWQGRVMGLAIYDEALAPAQIADDANHWLSGQGPARPPQPAPIALYLFNEGAGSQVREQMGSGNDLKIPARYRQLHAVFLDPVWNQYRTRWDGWRSSGYWDDVIVNVVGFVPVGILFAAYFSFVRPSARPWLSAVLFGFFLSLVIEVTQYWLPTRDSSMTDLVTNTVGTAIGAAIYRDGWALRLLAMLPAGSTRRIPMDPSASGGESVPSGKTQAL